MARDKGVFRLSNPWPRFAWLAWAAIVGISLALGFLVLDRYQQNDPPLGLWGAICRGLGITADTWPGERGCTAAAHSVAYSLDEQHARRRFGQAMHNMAASSP